MWFISSLTYRLDNTSKFWVLLIIKCILSEIQHCNRHKRLEAHFHPGLSHRWHMVLVVRALAKYLQGGDIMVVEHMRNLAQISERGEYWAHPG